jgi:hypothetical protein
MVSFTMSELELKTSARALLVACSEYIPHSVIETGVEYKSHKAYRIFFVV